MIDYENYTLYFDPTVQATTIFIFIELEYIMSKTDTIILFGRTIHTFFDLSYHLKKYVYNLHELLSNTTYQVVN